MVLSPLIITSISDSKPTVSAYIKVIRTSDGKIIGTYQAAENGGSFTSCKEMTEAIADTVAEKQFKAN